MTAAASVPDIAHAIQLAVAPVFLLTGVGSLLGVMATRLARIIDRGRYFEDGWKNLDDAARQAARAELIKLDRRRILASWAINFSTTAALLVCLVVMTLFANPYFAADLTWLAGLLFSSSMLALSAGLACFLREVYLATELVRFVNIGGPP